MEKKTCISCAIKKPLREYPKEKRCKSGYSGRCICCTREYKRAYISKWRKANKEKYLEYTRKYAANNRERINAMQRQRWREKNDKVTAYQREYYQKNREKILEYHRKYRKNTGSGKKACAKYKSKNKEKIKAHTKVLGAIRSGKLRQQPCVKCGEQKTEAHHDDYSKPFDIVWLCRKHHVQHHHKIS